MNKRQRSWAKNNGFTYRRAGGWTRGDGLSIAWSGGAWRVLTPGCGFHPTLSVPD